MEIESKLYIVCSRNNNAIYPTKVGLVYVATNAKESKVDSKTRPAHYVDELINRRIVDRSPTMKKCSFIALNGSHDTLREAEIMKNHGGGVA
jgi:hypothetical protein